jgi:exodeoxyribonuclease V alpha subunit
MESIKASIISIRYRNPERTWLVATMKYADKKDSFLATGDIPYSEDEEPVQLYGEWIEDKKYGRQFKVSTSHRILPTNTKGLSLYLANSEDIKGIGPVRANKLAENFGDKLLSILDGGQLEDLARVPGISIELSKRIISSWKRDSSVRTLAIFLSSHGISPRWSGKILEKWDVGKAIEQLQKNPYILTEIDGIGFNTADEMAMSLGMKKDAPERIDAACVFVVGEAIQDGNTFLHEFQLVDAIVKLIVPRGKDEAKVRDLAIKSVNKAIEEGKLVAETINDGVSTLRLLYLPHLYKAEKGLAEDITELNKYKHKVPSKLEQYIKEVQDNKHVQFSEKQVEAIRGAFSNRTMVITGGPGTGKTTCVHAICTIAEKLHLRCVLTAPTGRAAKRLSEVTGCDATTIHRLLKWREDGPTVGRDNPIEADLVIVDESSMLDIQLANKLCSALPESASIIFIGDADQLPAISAGSVLRDIISSHTIPVTTLDCVFRQAEESLIIRNSHLIRRGEMPRFPETKGVKEDSYVMWIPANSNADIKGKDDAKWVENMLSQLVSTSIPQKFSKEGKKIDPKRDIQVLVPMKKNTIGSNELNKVLQQTLNPNGKEFVAGGKVFRYGDRVIQTKNNYNEGMEVYNGDIGFIISNDTEDKSVRVDFDGRTVVYPYTELNDLQLAYVQTIHKAQGSEYPIVIVIMAYQHWPMLERNLIYTANTRAKELCLFIAAKGAIQQAVKNNPVKQRNSYLAQRLKELKCQSTSQE